MASAAVLREYLLTLGWKLDEQSQKKFMGALEGTTATVLKAGVAIAATAYAFTKGIEQIAGGYAELYFAAQRSGTTVSSLQAIGFAMGQIGISAESVEKSIESLNINMRTQPGLRAFSSMMLGVKADAKDTTATFIQLMNGLVKLPDFLKPKIGARFGVDMATIIMWEKNSGQILHDIEARRKMAAAAGVSPDDAAKVSKDLVQQFGILSEKLGLLATKTATTLMPYVNTFLVKVEALLDKFTAFNKDAGGAGGIVGGGLLAIIGGWLGLKAGGGLLGLFGRAVNRAAKGLGENKVLQKSLEFGADPRDFSGPGAAEARAAQAAEMGVGGLGLLGGIVALVTVVLAALGFKWLLDKAGEQDPEFKKKPLWQKLSESVSQYERAMGAPPPGSAPAKLPEHRIEVNQTNNVDASGHADPHAAASAMRIQLDALTGSQIEVAARITRNFRAPATAAAKE